ncbi:MAG: hypothetical protein VKJ46_13405 [Leptolyngbyaceae bacterium]|nr:hypothetical protein [Leptolyngbyaceae bacterium]
MPTPVEYFLGGISFPRTSIQSNQEETAPLPLLLISSNAEKSITTPGDWDAFACQDQSLTTMLSRPRRPRRLRQGRA